MTRLQHQLATNCVHWIADDARRDDRELCQRKQSKKGQIPAQIFFGDPSARRVENAEKDCARNDDELQRRDKSSIEADSAFASVNRSKAVEHSGEAFRPIVFCVDGQSSARKVQRIKKT